MATKNSEKTREMVMAALCPPSPVPDRTDKRNRKHAVPDAHSGSALCFFVQLEMGWRCGCGGTASSLLNLGNAADGADYILYDI